ncbi:TPA: class I SAM-dependent DNA methyltransferase [Vibrio parahaemolyticus]
MIFSQLRANKKVANERITENFVREKLRENSYYIPDNNIVIEEQKSSIKQVQNLLKTASKAGTGKGGYPEFIITWESDPNFLIVVECKADTKYHQSPNLDKPKDYAVDGVLHYARHLSKHYTVLALAVSGTSEDYMKVSNFLVPFGSDEHKELTNEDGTLVEEILSFNDYYRLSSFDPLVERKRHNDLILFAKELHELIWTAAKISEEDKPLLVSGTLIALMNTYFLQGFSIYSPEDMPKKWLEAIKYELDKADIPQAKKDTMLQPYAGVAAQPNLGKPDSKTAKKYPKGVLYEVIKEINENVWPFISVYHNFDVVGHFYGEFLKYTAGDKKALGIVLTPRHITELFCDIANITKKDTVIDICAGTGGFLISAMHRMLKTAMTEDERNDIKKNRLIGIENNPKMFALAASNMILRGDGKANLHQSSCFETTLKDAIVNPDEKRGVTRPNIGLLNPPYAQSKSDAELHELYFVKEMLDLLEEGGTGVAIIPVSCVISPNKAKHEILSKHTLKAVMSMPQELFYPVGTVTCIVVFEAHKPHKGTKKKTWFGYWREDGYVKTKHMGRIDLNHQWKDIKERWLEMYNNNEVHVGESVTAYVDADDEWIAEAYMETDYNALAREDFEEVVKNYAAFKLMGSI